MARREQAYSERLVGPGTVELWDKDHLRGAVALEAQSCQNCGKTGMNISTFHQPPRGVAH